MSEPAPRAPAILALLHRAFESPALAAAAFDVERLLAHVPAAAERARGPNLVAKLAIGWIALARRNSVRASAPIRGRPLTRCASCARGWSNSISRPRHVAEQILERLGE